MKKFNDVENTDKTPNGNHAPGVNTPPGVNANGAKKTSTTSTTPEPSITSVAEEILSGEYPQWLIKSQGLLTKLDGAQHELKKKRSILAILAAEFTGTKKGDVYKRPEIVSQSNLSVKWMRDPIFKEVITGIRKIMLEEVEEIELKSMRQALALSRIATVRATQVRVELLDNPSPWVKLQAARDIMNTALSQTGNPSGREVDEKFTQKVSTEEYSSLITAARGDLAAFMAELHDTAEASHRDTKLGAKPLVIENYREDSDDS